MVSYRSGSGPHDLGTAQRIATALGLSVSTLAKAAEKLEGN